LSSAGFGAFEKMKCIFFYCTDGKFGEVVGVFYTHRTLAIDASDAGLASGALWKLSACFNRASERPMGECRTLVEHC